MATLKFAFRIKDMSNTIKKRIDWCSRDSELTGFQRYLMGYLIWEKAGEDVYQKDIEKQFRISRASVTSMLQLMEKNGFIRREAVPQDARLKKIVVTEKGIYEQNRNSEVIAQVEQELVQGIDEKDLETFLNVLDRMRKNLDLISAADRGREETIHTIEEE